MTAHLRVAIVVVLLGAVGGAASSAPRKDTSNPAGCDWGASSVSARFVDGRWVVETPHTSGCIP